MASVKLSWEMKMSAFEGKLDSVLKELKDLKKGMDFVNAAFEDFRKEVKGVKEKQVELENEHKLLKELVKNQDKEISDLKKRMEVIDRNKLLSTVEFSSVHQVEGENILSVVADIARAVDIQLKEGDVVKAFRRGKAKSGRVGALVVTCKDSQLRDRFISGVKQKKLSNENIGIVGNKNSIYAREELTQLGRDLFFKALDFKKRNGWSYVWVKDGKVFIREKQGSRYFIISSMTDIDRLSSV